MMTSFYNLKKYAETGIASPGMTAFDKMRALSAFGGFPIASLIGEDEIQFYSDGTPLTAWSISGNKEQGGPQETGDRTENLLDYTTVQNGPSATATLITDGLAVSGKFYVSFSSVNFEVGTKYFMSWDYVATSGNPKTQWRLKYTDGTYSDAKGIGTSITIPKEVDLLLLYISTQETSSANITNIMLNTGSTSLPYEPYGKYKLPITLAGQTQAVYLDEPLRKALDGSDAVDVLRSDGTLTREVDSSGNALATPTTETVTVPNLRPQKGSNTLSVETTLAPSEIGITGHIKAV